MSSAVDTARDLALLKIGRNVVNFQKMEVMLQFIVTFANFSVPMSQIAEHLQSASKNIRKAPMGLLADKASKAIRSDHKSAPRHAAEVWISFSLKLEAGAIHPKEWRRVMREVVKERNALIHQMLVSFDPSSLDSCNALSGLLDEQRERILPAYQHLESLVKAIRETHQEIAANVDSILSIEAHRVPTNGV
jgi:hypothetical protein